MAFRGYRKPNKHKEAKTKPTQAKLATRRKRQTTRRTTTPSKRTGNKHRIRTQIAAGRVPEGNPVAAFSAKFLWETVKWRSPKNRRRRKRLKNLGNWKRPKIHNSFLAYKTSGFVRWPKTLRTEEAPTPKVYKNMSTIWLPIWGPESQKRQKTLRFKRNFRISSPTQFGWAKKSAHFRAHRGGKVAIWARHSISTKPPENKHETARRVIWTHPGDQIPLLKRQNVTRFPSYSFACLRNLHPKHQMERTGKSNKMFKELITAKWCQEPKVGRAHVGSMMLSTNTDSPWRQRNEEMWPRSWLRTPTPNVSTASTSMRTVRARQKLAQWIIWCEGHFRSPAAAPLVIMSRIWTSYNRFLQVRFWQGCFGSDTCLHSCVSMPRLQSS